MRNSKKMVMMTLSVFWMLGCHSPSNGRGAQYLVPWIESDGHYAMRTVTLSTLDDPEELSGTAAQIHYASREQASGYSTAVARPHLTFANGVYVPLDAPSALALGAYAQMESLYNYETKFGIDSQVPWPRQVGVEVAEFAGMKLGHNNAYYFPAYDTLALIPYNGSHVPMALNQGVVAHEHFHAHFQHMVMSRVNFAHSTVAAVDGLFYPGIFGFPTSGTRVSGPPTPSISFLNGVVLRAWNEGLADLFGSIYLHQPDLFAASLPEAAAPRRLDGDPTPMISARELVAAVAKHAPESQNLVSLAYRQGTRLARLMYSVAKQDPQSVEHFEVQLIGNLEQIPDLVNAKRPEQVLDFEAVVPVLMRGVALTPGVCRTLRHVVSVDQMRESFSQCPTP